MAHIHEKIDWTVETYIVHKDKVLLRKHDKYKLWLSVGGHIELDEGPLEAAKKECLEEVGLSVKIYGEDDCQTWKGDVHDLPTPISMYRHPVNDAHEHITIIYFGTSDSNDISPENKNDIWQWFTKDEIENHPEIEPHIKKYALLSLKTLIQ